MTTAEFFLWTALLFVIIFLRYLLFSGLYHYLFRWRWRDRFSKRIFHYQPEKGSAIKREIIRSAGVSLIFATAGISTLWLWVNEYTLLYLPFGERYWLWLLLSPTLFLAAQETYYYWTHRWMHRPGIYESVHRWHHESIETTAFTAFSFHPLEALLQAIFLPLIVLILPMQVYIFLSLLTLMTLSATINHAGIEIFPASWERLPILNKLIGATHHDLHHKQAQTNFGLYFTFWDEWMGTESHKYKARFKKHTS
ncbi:MAG: sterol desaturase family protein [Bacteroidota bacterium]